MSMRITVAAAVAVVAIGILEAEARQERAPAAPSAPVGTQPAQPAASTPAPVIRTQGADGEQPNFKPEELEQILAPVALYPDSLLSQVLMASTYPLEVVQADRWVKQNKDVKGDALAKALENAEWDPSVKSLVNFPDVLAMMSDKLDWTQQLGDAFIGQQKEVMDAVQKLRGRAKGAGKLETTKEQTVKVEPAAAGATTQTIVIESSNPDVIYVPAYNPTVVYGSWPYPAYPPYPYYPPGYTLGAAAIGFGVGVACGAAWGYAWGNCNWGHGDVDIDINNNFNRNTNIDRSKYQRQNNFNGGKGQFQHNPAHRGNVPYRNNAEASRFGGQSQRQAATARDSYRGRADAGRQNLGSVDRSQLGNRQAEGMRSAGEGNRSSAFQGMDRGGGAARAESNRGNSSRSGGMAPRSSGGQRSFSGGGGGSRSSGMSRGGGGRGGGGRGGGRR